MNQRPVPGCWSLHASEWFATKSIAESQRRVLWYRSAESIISKPDAIDYNEIECPTLLFLLLKTSNFVRGTRKLRDVIINGQELTVDFFLPLLQFTERKVEIFFDGMG